MSNSLDRSQVLGVVLAHGKARDTVIRHLPYWFKICEKLLVVTPIGQPLNLNNPDVTELQLVADGGSYSTSTNQRCYEALKAGYAVGTPFVMLWEYDSLAWGPVPLGAIPERGSMAAIYWQNERISPIHPKTFMGNFYLHFPHLYSRQGLELVIGTMESSMNMTEEHGYTDRFLGLAVELSGIPVLNWTGLGLSYSFEDITSHGARIDGCIHAVQNGALFSHGIKSEAGLHKIAVHAPFGLLKS